MNITMTHVNGRTYIFGATWQQPGGRDAAVDDAQIRQLQREALALESEAA